MVTQTANIRRQLTLFVNVADAAVIERVRKEYNPKQYQFIEGHITLCREDEIENLPQVFQNLK